MQSKPSVTHVFLKDVGLVERLHVEARREHRTMLGVVTIALERYFAALDQEREAKGPA